MMREQLSKATKSRRLASAATPKRPSKKESSTSAKTSSRQKSATATTAKKTTLKAAPKNKTIAKPKLATKVAAATKKVETRPASPAKKQPAKAPVKPTSLGKASAKPILKSVKSSLLTKPMAKASAKAASVSRHQMATQALRAFEQAVKVFNLREFSEAKSMFEELQKRYHQEVEIIARSQTYIQVCNVRLASNRALPRNADEFYDRGVVALNVGNFAQARTLFEKALKLRPDDSYTLYSLAATYAQSGSADQALTYLEQAVRRQPRLRQQALNDADFSMLKENRRFLELLGATSPFDLLDARREIS